MQGGALLLEFDERRALFGSGVIDGGKTRHDVAADGGQSEAADDETVAEVLLQADRDSCAGGDLDRLLKLEGGPVRFSKLLPDGPGGLALFGDEIFDLVALLRVVGVGGPELHRLCAAVRLGEGAVEAVKHEIGSGGASATGAAARNGGMRETFEKEAVDRACRQFAFDGVGVLLRHGTCEERAAVGLEFGFGVAVRDESVEFQHADRVGVRFGNGG